MKTKHILAALALPMVFVACSDEQYESSRVNNPLGDRPVIGNVTFVDGNANTRAIDATDGSSKYTEGEQFGLALMDEVYDIDASAFTDRYTLKNAVWTNYPFTRDANGNWTSPASLVEGNYFTYMPFKNGKVTAARDGMKWVIDAEQKAYAEGSKEVTKYQAVKDNQIFFGYVPMEADATGATATELDMNLVAAHATPAFKITNMDASKSVEIRKISLENTTTASGDAILALAGELDVENGISSKEFKLNDETATAGSNIAAVFNVYNNATATEKEDAFHNNPLYTGSFLSSKADAANKISLRFPDVTLASNKSTAAYMVVPAITTANACEKLQVVIYTNKGTVTAPLKAGKYKWNFSRDAFETAGTTDTPVLTVALAQKGIDTTPEAANQGYKELAADESFASMKANDFSSIAISFTEEAIVVPTEMKIATTADLDDFLGYREVSQQVGTEASPVGLTGIITGDGVELSKDAYDILKKYPYVKLTVKAANAKSLTISKNITGTDALEVLTFGDNTSAIISEGATQVVSKDFNKGILNKGVLTIKDSEAPIAAITTDEIYNVGTLNIATALTATVHNGVPATAAYENAVSTAQMNINATVGTVDNYASVKVSGDAAITITALNNKALAKSENPDKVGSVEVDANVTVTSLVTEAKSTLTVNAGKSFITKGTNAGIITNNGQIEIAGGEFKNTGTVTNNYGIVCQSGGTFVNVAGMTVGENAIYTYISDNEDGEIVIEKRDAELRIGTEDKAGIITYVADDEQGDWSNNKFKVLSGDKFNKLIIQKSGTVDLSAVAAATTSIVLDVDATSTYSFPTGTGRQFTSMTVGKEGATSPYVIQIKGGTSADGVVVTESLTVNEKATMHITTGNQFTFKGVSITNNGTILVGGIFTTTVMEKPADAAEAAKYKEAGGSFKWYTPSIN